MFILTSLFLLSTYSAIFAGEQIAELFHYIQDKDALGEEALPRVIKDAEQGNIHARYVLAARQIDVVKNTEEAIKQLEALSNDGYIHSCKVRSCRTISKVKLS